GRDKEQDIVLPGDKVSRRHLRIERGLGNVYRVIDLGSKNGSFLGNYRLLNNVSEIWEKTDTIRIGNYWIRIEAAEDPDEKTALLKAREARQQSEFDTDGGSAAAPPPPPPPPPPAELEKIGVSVNGSVLRVVPGSSTTLPIEIINRSDLVDHFKVEVVGLPANWVTQPSDPLYLLPSKRDTTSVTFHPP
ncbi:MAG: FHA domain-containing protein, partial [Anaerolineae bacterium]|nr:FHA domain-containing protein [Anaerolineae bacterium]